VSTPTAAQMLAYQATWIGTGEKPPGSNKVPGITDKFGMTGPWCFMFQSEMFDHFGALSLIHGKHAYVPDFRSVFQPHGEFHTSNPAPGDLVAFDFNSSGEPEHIGIVEKVISSSVIQTIEGNTSDHVMRRTRSRSYVYGYATPKYAAAPTPNPNNWPGRVLSYSKGRTITHGSDVTWVQQRLTAHGHRVTADGYYGPATAAAVTAFQKAAKLTADGQVGPQTWGALAK
jgi:hypothetical protein